MRGGVYRRSHGVYLLGPLYESIDVLAEASLVADAQLEADGTVVAPQTVTGAAALVADAVLGAAGGLLAAFGDVALVGGAELAATPNTIDAGACQIVAGATLTAEGTGGSDASVDPTGRRSGIVSIGIRGGHS